MNICTREEITNFLYTFFLSYYYSIILIPLNEPKKKYFDVIINNNIIDLFQYNKFNDISIGRICIGKFVNELMTFCINKTKQVNINDIDDSIKNLSKLHESAIYSIVNEIRKESYNLTYIELEDMVEKSSSMMSIFMCETCNEIYLFSKKMN